MGRDEGVHDVCFDGRTDGGRGGGGRGGWS